MILKVTFKAIFMPWRGCVIFKTFQSFDQIMINLDFLALNTYQIKQNLIICFETF